MLTINNAYKYLKMLCNYTLSLRSNLVTIPLEKKRNNDMYNILFTISGESNDSLFIMIDNQEHLVQLQNGTCVFSHVFSDIPENINMYISDKHKTNTYHILINYQQSDSVFPISIGTSNYSLKIDTDYAVLGNKYPTRHNNNVKFYANGEKYFADLYQTIINAKKFIYIIGWSFDPSIRLMRDGSDDRCVGEIILDKARNGVDCRVLVWDDPTSIRNLLPGLMNTTDENTHSFFENTDVKCHLVSRHEGSYPGAKLIFSYHIKNVIADSLDNYVAYVGGMDITHGRWDDDSFHLYKGLDGQFKNDFYQTEPLLKANRKGPRQPWHDMHSRIYGDVVQDIYNNFVNIWNTKLSEKITNNINFCNTEHFPDNFSVQFFRSISKDSDNTIDNYESDIHNAYINAIRKAKRFIYIENQYFVGSSQKWKTNKNNCLINDIPHEIVKRIKKSIHNNTDFKVYIVLPLMPEGDPKSATVAEMMKWSFLTIHMMYTEINETLKSCGTSRCATDYLNLYTLGNRERPTEIIIDPQDNVQRKFDLSNRYMIYVHSKMMIVDDAYILIGSANINGRSMGGNRDAEACVGIYGNNDKIKSFRQKLWTTLLRGNYEKLYDAPETDDALKLFNDITIRSWNQYATYTYTNLDSFMMRLPICVEPNSVSYKISVPDFNIKFEGSSSIFLPDIFTV